MSQELAELNLHISLSISFLRVVKLNEILSKTTQKTVQIARNSPDWMNIWKTQGAATIYANAIFFRR